MLFCRSRILRKKSLDSSLTGLTVGAGANGGPPMLYPKDGPFIEVVIVGGGAGWRAMKDGIRRPSKSITRGSTVNRYGSKQTNV